jgi:uncharacterized glyoxalase superfamily protein PhnB
MISVPRLTLVVVVLALSGCFLVRDPIAATRPSCTLTLQVADVEAKHTQLAARGVRFEKPPQKLYWGYGAELSDPDGYRVHVWDEKSMREKGDA